MAPEPVKGPSRAFYGLQVNFHSRKTIMINAEQLRLEIAARNLLNEKSIELRESLREMLIPAYIGKKIVKTTPYKSWVAQVRDKVASVEKEIGVGLIGNTAKFRSSYTFGSYAIWCDIDLNYPVGQGVHYVKREFTICTLSGFCLADDSDTKVKNPRTDYTFDEVYGKIIELDEYKAKVSEIESEFRDFCGFFSRY